MESVQWWWRCSVEVSVQVLCSPLRGHDVTGVTCRWQMAHEPMKSFTPAYNFNIITYWKLDRRGSVSSDWGFLFKLRADWKLIFNIEPERQYHHKSESWPGKVKPNPSAPAHSEDSTVAAGWWTINIKNSGPQLQLQLLGCNKAVVIIPGVNPETTS